MATVSLNGDFLAAATVGEWVEAEGEVVRRTRALVFTRGAILCGERTLLTASGLWKIFDNAGGAAPTPGR